MLGCLNGVSKGVDVDVGVLLLEVESRSESNGSGTTTALVDTLNLQFGNEIVALLGGLTIEGKVGSFSTEVLDVFWVLGRQGVQLAGQVVAGLSGKGA